MKKINAFMLIQWIVFVPIILPISIIIGAYEGILKVFERASSDVYERSKLI
jgi:hypothetical protein